MDIPVYLVAGFLDSGKTSFINGILEDGFAREDRTLLICCEEGDEEYEKKALDNVTVVTVDDEEELTLAFCKELEKKHRPKQVLIEYNGMWQLQQLFQNLPDDWAVYQEMFFADATTFLQYNANMRSLVVDKLNTCELVVFNRFGKDMDKMEFHKIVRGVSRRTDIAYEYADGHVEYDEIEDPLPFDVNAPVIRHVTASHPAVRRIHNRIAPERGDIALPEIQPLLHRRKVVDIRHALFCRLLLQIRILNVQKFCTALFHHAHIHQPPQKLSLPGAVRRNLHSAVLPALFQQ